MNFKIFVFVAGLSTLIFTILQSEPSFNGSSAGCAGSGCHSFQDNDISVAHTGNLQIEVNLSGVQNGKKVGGELIDQNGTVVDVINSTSSNPFVLTAPTEGKYLVNAGYKSPTRHWDSSSVDIVVASVGTIYSDDVLTSYQLSQNYPNPFNPSTTIKFAIPKSEFVTLKIYNSIGQEVASLVSDNLSAGNYTYSWNAGPLAGGVYFYKIQAGDPSTNSPEGQAGQGFSQIRKMVYLK